MRKIRVLIVDDSVTVRHLLWKIFREEKVFDVVGMLSNGREAVDRVNELKPDIVTLDIEMPVMGGLDTLTALRRLQPRLQVIVLSSQTTAGALTTLEALSRGAVDYVPKPEGLADVDAGLLYIRTQLVPKVKALCANTVGLSDEVANDVAVPSATPATPPPRRSEGGGKYSLLVIGSSMGGPNALAAVLPRLGQDFPLPVLIAQHMPPMFTNLLAQRLKADGPLPVEEATQGMHLRPGHVYIAPGNAHMTVEGNGNGLHIHLYAGDIPHVLCKPSVDVLFESAAKLCGNQTLAAVLSGMGNDGLKGCTAIHNVGGHILVQDRETSVVWGMPGFVANAGLAQGVLALQDMGPMLARKAWLGRTRGS